MSIQTRVPGVPVCKLLVGLLGSCQDPHSGRAARVGEVLVHRSWRFSIAPASVGTGPQRRATPSRWSKCLFREHRFPIVLD
jgi:hypothetical protein